MASQAHRRRPTLGHAASSAAAAGAGAAPSSIVSPDAFKASLRTLTLDEMAALPASIAAKHAAVQSNLGRLAAQHIHDVLHARTAVAALPALRTKLRQQLGQIQSHACPQLTAALAQLPQHAGPPILRYQRSDTLAKTLADEEALSWLLHAPVTVKNLVSAATSTTSRNDTSTADTLFEQGSTLEAGNIESGSQAASAALSITMRLFALAAPGSVLLASSSSSQTEASSDPLKPSIGSLSRRPTASSLVRRRDQVDDEALQRAAAQRSVQAIATEALTHLHSLKLRRVQRTLAEPGLRLADAIRVVTLIRHMRNLRPHQQHDQGQQVPQGLGDEASKAGELDDLGLSESQLMLAFFQARIAVLRHLLASPPSPSTNSQHLPTSPLPSGSFASKQGQDSGEETLPPAFVELRDRLEPGATVALVETWTTHVRRTLSIADAVFGGGQEGGDIPSASTATPSASLSSAASQERDRTTLALLRSSFAAYSVRLLAARLEEAQEGGGDRDGGGGAVSSAGRGQDGTLEGARPRPLPAVRLRASSASRRGEETAERASASARRRKKGEERIAMALHLYTYTLL